MAKHNSQTEGMDARRPFADDLEHVFKRIGISLEDYAELGVEIAKAQYPPRHIPYHPQTIIGWLGGELLPNDLTMVALGKALAARCTDPALAEKTPDYFTEGRIAKLLDAAQAEELELGFKPTELTHAMMLTRDMCFKSGVALADYVKTKTEKAPDFYREQGRASLSMTLNGKIVSSPSKSLTYILQDAQDAYVRKHPGRANDVPKITALHEQALRERADSLWISAEREHDLGGMIRAIRIRFGQSLDQFAERVAPYDENRERYGSMVTYWETNTNVPVGYAGGRQLKETLCEHIIEITKTLDEAPNRLSRSIDEPWFSPEKEAIFREAFSARVRANASLYEPISQELSDSPDMRSARPSHKISEASLSQQIMEGIKR